MRHIERPAAAASDAPTVQISPLRDGVFVTLLLLLLLSMIVFTQFGSTYPLFLRDHFGMDKPMIGLMFAVNTTVIVAVEMLLLDAIKHWPVVRTIGWGCFLFCLGWGILPFGQTAAFAVLAMLIVTVGEMLSFAMSTGFVANRSGPGGESAYMGWYMVMFAVASVLGPGIGGAIYQVNPNAVWYVSLAVGVLVLIGFQLLALRVREDADETLEEALEEAAGETSADLFPEPQPGQPLIGIPESV
jgi:MFS family permease